MILRPPPDGFKISAAMLRVEVHEWLRIQLSFWLPPYLPENTNVGDTHQLLAQDVQAVCYMVSDNVVTVSEGPLLLLLVVFVVPLQSFANEVLCSISQSTRFERSSVHLTKQCK